MIACWSLLATGREQSCLAGGNELDQAVRGVPERTAYLESRLQIEPDNGCSNDPELTGATQQHIPRLPALERQRLAGDIGAALAVIARLTASAGPALPGTAVAIAGPAAEVPLGAGPQPFFSSSSKSAGPR